MKSLFKLVFIAVLSYGAFALTSLIVNHQVPQMTSDVALSQFENDDSAAYADARVVNQNVDKAYVLPSVVFAFTVCVTSFILFGFSGTKLHETPVQGKK